MKISETRSSVAELVSQNQINDKKVGTGPEKQAASGVDTEEKVSLSSMAKDFQKAQKAIGELPDVREEKVQELKDQIQSERYDVNGEKIAEKMLSESLLDVIV
ncbi:MAG: flagellar biosynthesis anti-sigma factor FlgM [Deltaproteobacteria bacterium]|nr:flagellar biosynthesis anti-sigma factor FlgM [Deltaproteobacteria bacterium]